MSTSAERISYFTLQMKDVPGEGARLLRLLNKHKVNLLALTAFPSGRGSQVDLVPDDKDRLLALEEQLEWRLSPEKRAFLLLGPNQAGALLPAFERLARMKINVTAVEAVMASKARFGALLWVKPADYERAARALGAG
jgi:prephenate dehydratase